jgi:hypothetical protein
LYKGNSDSTIRVLWEKEHFQRPWLEIPPIAALQISFALFGACICMAKFRNAASEQIDADIGSGRGVRAHEASLYRIAGAATAKLTKLAEQGRCQ